MRRRRVALIAGGRSSEHDISLASARSVLEALDPATHEVVTVGIGRDGTWQLGGPDGQALGSDPQTRLLGTASASEQGQASPAGLAPTDSSGHVEGSGPDGPAETLPVPATSASVTQTLAEVDVVIPILHGPFGEDGTVQGLLELANVPYVGAGVAASALCMDKDLFKSVMRDHEIPVTENVTLRHGATLDESPYGYPVFVKPARLGSSVGITKAHDAAELAAAIELAYRHDEKLLVEEFVGGVEVECSVLGNRTPIASIPGEIRTLDHEWYDFSSKYDEDGMELVIPPDLPDETIARVQQLAVEAFVASECEGMARVDFFVRADGEVVVNELNTIPGFTATSVYAKLFEASGIPYAELLERLIDLALERHERRARLQY
ncbi:MAG: D-alanine--D-alanine ligase [Actinomycetota bacterium]|nr:D-alanine--D-alanine ligase [Actinomycetota bacterium]